MSNSSNNNNNNNSSPNQVVITKITRVSNSDLSNIKNILVKKQVITSSANKSSDAAAAAASTSASLRITPVVSTFNRHVITNSDDPLQTANENQRFYQQQQQQQQHQIVKLTDNDPSSRSLTTVSLQPTAELNNLTNIKNILNKKQVITLTKATSDFISSSTANTNVVKLKPIAAAAANTTNSSSPNGMIRITPVSGSSLSSNVVKITPVASSSSATSLLSHHTSLTKLNNPTHVKFYDNQSPQQQQQQHMTDKNNKTMLANTLETAPK